MKQTYHKRELWDENSEMDGGQLIIEVALEPAERVEWRKAAKLPYADFIETDIVVKVCECGKVVQPHLAAQPGASYVDQPSFRRHLVGGRVFISQSFGWDV